MDKEARLKQDLTRTRNGLWCGISPYNTGAAWIWQGDQFVTRDHEDVRTNEWIAWSITPVGVPNPELFDKDGEFALFTRDTQHVSYALTDAATSSTANTNASSAVSAATALAQRLLKAHAISSGTSVATAPSAPTTSTVSASTTHPPSSLVPSAAGTSASHAQSATVSTSALPSSQSATVGMSAQPSQSGVRQTQPPAVTTRAAARASARGTAMLIVNDTMATVERIKGTTPSNTFQSTEHVHGTIAEALAFLAEFDMADALDVQDVEDALAMQLHESFACIASGSTDARERVLRALDCIDDAVVSKAKELTIEGTPKDYLMNISTTVEQFEVLYVLSPDQELDNSSIISGAVGFHGGMVTLFDKEGRPYQLDEPNGWAQHARSKFKEEWDSELVHEVTKLEDAGTWLRVPADAAKGHKVHKLKPVHKVKKNEYGGFDNRRLRLVILGNRFEQGVDYLEHFSCGIGFPELRMLLIAVVNKPMRPSGKYWVRFRFDCINAFPQVPIERKIFIELPKHPLFDWRDPQTNKDDVGWLQGNQYGTPPAPRTFSKQFHKALKSEPLNLSSCPVQHSVFSRDGPDGSGILVGTYVDEGFGGASELDLLMWFVKKLEEKGFPLKLHFTWSPLLGFGCEVDEEQRTVAFSTQKYTRDLASKYLPGETRPQRAQQSRQTIMDLPAEPLPALGSKEDLALASMQADFRALSGGITHLCRGRCDIILENALCSQGAARPTHKHFEHLKEALRYAWAHEDDVHLHHTKYGLSVSRDIEPIRPYDSDQPFPCTATLLRHTPHCKVEYGLYAITDGAQAKPGVDVPNSKSMGGIAIMFGAAAIDWKSYRFHTTVIDSTTAEMLPVSRSTSKLYLYRGVATFIGIPQDVPTPCLTDNDGVWSIARDATGTTSLMYVIRHVRFVQASQENTIIKTHQMDGRLNPVDPFTKHKDKESRKRDFLFLRGYPQEAYKVWLASRAFQNFTPHKIVEQPKPPIEIDETKLASYPRARLRVTTPSKAGDVVPLTSAPPLSKAEFKQALISKDEVGLSHATSRGVDGMSATQVSDIMKDPNSNITNATIWTSSKE
jgi:hypothetical protein